VFISVHLWLIFSVVPEQLQLGYQRRQLFHVGAVPITPPVAKLRQPGYAGALRPGQAGIRMRRTWLFRAGHRRAWIAARQAKIL